MMVQVLQMKSSLGAEKALIDVSENANRSGFKNIRDILNVNFGSLEARSLLNL